MKTYKTAMPELTLKYKSGEILKAKIGSSNDSAEYFRKVFNADTIEYSEEVCVLYLNNANNTIGWQKHSSGGTSYCVVDIKTILTTALLCGAAAVLVAHNHPSGEMRPSTEDNNVTKRLKDGCTAVGLRLLDHIILSGADYRYYSFADEGKL